MGHRRHRSRSLARFSAMASRSTSAASRWPRPSPTWSIWYSRVGRSARRTAPPPSGQGSLSGRGTPPSLPPVVVREEVANSVTHGLGLSASLAGAFVLVSLSLEQGKRGALLARPFTVLR